MADYHPLIAKLIDGLSEPADRAAVYERARRALDEQLKGVEPPLGVGDIAREAERLETAISDLEAGQRILPNAGPTSGQHSGGPEPGLQPARARRPNLADRARHLQPEAVPIRRGGRRRTPTALIVVLSVIAIPAALLGWFWRQPQQPASRPVVAEAPDPAPQPAIPQDNKFAERVTGAAGSQQPGPAGSRSPDARPPLPAATADQPRSQPSAPAASSLAPPAALAVAQRALLFEENQVDPQKPMVSVGSAIWRLDSLAGGQGMPLETVIRGTTEYPNSGLSLNLILRRNLDAALPASHTIELSFSSTVPPGGQARVVRDVGLPQMRPEEAIRGVALAGLPVPVKENIFLIGLSDLKGDIDRNTELLLRRNWMEVPIRFASGQKAALLIEKGVSGDRVFQEAFRLWTQSP